ncbi:hypothetical protein BVG16_01455 [Paenibacillus selenitireducens]|uniref:Large ribosomal subunit protein bL25 n=1 Tax=Paenibacillus selenitireducens TaxID=1324314 RepID=A0A1T2XMJ7_9BACL|nr:50S ribosomal protein L25 [Paenibacillus selenitireducens]OPA81038.1 hypothetical protein BVG16_01455 [Paenibacillus selenitireducens]
MNMSIQAKNRSQVNRSGLRQLRAEGRIPCIVYGKHIDARMIHISNRELQQWLKQGDSGVLELDMPDQGKIPVLLEDVQRDPVTQNVLHADFQHVKMDELVRTKISVEFSGKAAGVKVGGVMQIQGSQIEVEGLPGHLPAFITADVSHLGIGDTLLVEHLNLPKEIHVISSSEELLVSIVAPRLEQLDENAEALV